MSDSVPVVLVQMPFAPSKYPNLGLSLLKAVLAGCGVSSQIVYFNLLLQQLLGSEDYCHVTMEPCQKLIGEWAFTEALFGKDEGRDAAYLRTILPETDQKARLSAAHARSAALTFLGQCLHAISWPQVRIVGFASTFQQHVPALALARRLRLRHPELTIVFGGANCEGNMGAATLEQFPFVDAVCSGEGEQAFTEFVLERLSNRSSRIPGILSRGLSEEQGASAVVGHQPRPFCVQNLDELPYPDFDDYFSALARWPVPQSPALSFETSRGCWWGERHQCAFCGLNGRSLAFRAKSPDRALKEIQWLLNRYGNQTTAISAVDNIMPHHYLHYFIPRLNELDPRPGLFYEIKANLTEGQVAQLKRAGVAKIQPGIETLNSAVLTLIRKGVSAIQNVQLLKWCAQYGVHPCWNYLYGFPDESWATYGGQVALLRKLRHLPPPAGFGPVLIERFSPYHSTPDRFGIANVRPHPAYEYVYAGLPDGRVKELSYYFVGDYQAKADMERYAGEISEVLADWQSSAGNTTLCHKSVGNETVVVDGREPSSLSFFVLCNEIRAMFEYCATARSESRLCAHFDALGVSEGRWKKAVAELVDRDLVIHEDGRFLAVSVALGESYHIPRPVKDRLNSLRISCGGKDPGGLFALPSHLYTILS